LDLKIRINHIQLLVNRSMNDYINRVQVGKAASLQLDCLQAIECDWFYFSFQRSI